MLNSTMYFCLLRIYVIFTVKKSLVFRSAKLLKSLYLTTDRLFPTKRHIKTPLRKLPKSTQRNFGDTFYVTFTKL